MSVVSFIQSSWLKTFRFVQLFGLLADCSLQFKKKWNGVSSDSSHSHIGEAQRLNFHFMSASFRELPIRNSQILLAVYESPHIIGEISLNAGTLAVRFVRKELLNPLFHRLRHWSVINPAIWSLVYSRMVSLFKAYQICWILPREKKSPKQAAKSAVKRTVKNQIGGSASIKKSKPVKRNSQRKKKLQRRRSNFFSRVNNDT